MAQSDPRWLILANPDTAGCGKTTTREDPNRQDDVSPEEQPRNPPSEPIFSNEGTGLLINTVHTEPDAAAEFSEQDPRFREPTRHATPQITDSKPDVHVVGLDALPEQESAQPAILQIIACLGDNRSDVRKNGADALAKVSKRAEFREPIKFGIPKIIALLGNSDEGVCRTGADVLLKLREQAEFRQLITNVPAILQIANLCPGINHGVHEAGVAVLEKLPEQGINPNTVSDTIDTDETDSITYWVAAGAALQHARHQMSAVSAAFYKRNIPESEYVVYAGFDESLIRSGVGYLEQIHVFISTEVDTVSLIFELGRIFSPFSSILFTKSSSFRMPAFKDGKVWEFYDLVYSTVSRFGGGGSNNKTPPIVSSLSHNPSGAGDLTGFSSQGGSGGGEGGEGGEGRRQRSGKGRERDREDEDEANKGDSNDKDPDGDPEEPPENGGGNGSRLARYSFEIFSKIHPIHNQQNDIPRLTMHGRLTVKTVPLTPRQFSTRHLEFTKLTFGTEKIMHSAYEQRHVTVKVDPRQENADVEVIKPKRTRQYDSEQKGLTSTTKSQSFGARAALSLGPHPQGTIAATSARTNEETAGLERRRYLSRITEQTTCGSVTWGFTIDDAYDQEGGVDMLQDVLPTVDFEFFGDTDVPAPPPDSMGIKISSLWSMISGTAEWTNSMLNRPGSSGDEQVSYSNLCQVVCLEMDPSKLPERSRYRATLHVRPGIPEPGCVSCSTQVVRSTTAGLVEVTSSVDADIDSLPKLSSSKFLTHIKSKLSGFCKQTLEHLGKNH